MSSLTVIEKRTLEKFLKMEYGYVLDFSNRNFQQFIMECTGLDIDDESIGGTGSKANRLRYLWTHQPDHIVGKQLKGFIDYVEIESPLRDKCTVIAGRLLVGFRVTTHADEDRIWGGKGYRVFLSHKSEVKKETAELKKQLGSFGISGFVAHADIKPTRHWQDEIEKALASMHGFVALLTKGFHDSNWTDQEVGYALARGVPLIAVKIERDPYGFIGKFQALSSSWSSAPGEIAKLLIAQPRMLDAFVDAAANCSSFDQGNELSAVLPHIEVLSADQADRLVSAFNENAQLQGSFGFSGDKEWRWGPGLACHLKRAAGGDYEMKKVGSYKLRLQKK